VRRNSCLSLGLPSAGAACPHPVFRETAKSSDRSGVRVRVRARESAAVAKK